MEVTDNNGSVAENADGTTGRSEDSIYSDFAYDDAFRTEESECDDLLIPYVNYCHNEHYDVNTAKVIRGRNEHFIEMPDHSEQKRVADASFDIVQGDRRKSYHHECESGGYDDSLLVRMFEYETQTALDRKEISKGHMRVEIPYSGILVLRGRRKLDRAYIEVVTPGGEVIYPVEIRYMSDLTIDGIFEKHLYMLLPFYVFNLEGELGEIDADPTRLEGFADIYRDIMERLDEHMDKGCLSRLSHSVIISLIHKVIYKITTRRKVVYKNVQKKAGEIMGGRVLDLEVLRAHHQGMAEGEKIGEARGRTEERENNIRKLAASYMSQDSSLTKEKAMEMARAILE